MDYLQFYVQRNFRYKVCVAPSDLFNLFCSFKGHNKILIFCEEYNIEK